jgi:hypothetical protein
MAPAMGRFNDRRTANWGIKDIVIVLVVSVVVAVALVLLAGVGIRLFGREDAVTLVRSQPVVLSAVTGVVVYLIIFSMVYLRIVRRQPDGWRAVGFRPPPLLPMALAPLILIGQLTIVAVMNSLILKLTGAFENPQIDKITGGQGFSWLNFGLMLFLAGGVAPVVEELFFRGVLYGWLRSRLPVAFAIVISAAFFAAAHVIPVLLPALFVVGIILATAYELSGSLWISILLHALQNSLAVIVIFVALTMHLPLTR